MLIESKRWMPHLRRLCVHTHICEESKKKKKITAIFLCLSSFNSFVFPPFSSHKATDCSTTVMMTLETPDPDSPIHLLLITWSRKFPSPDFGA